MFSLVFLIVRIVFFVFSIMFGKTSLLFLLLLHSIICCELCFLRQQFSFVLTHCVVPYCIVCDFIIRVSNYVFPNPGLQGDRPLWAGASNKLCIFFPRKENLCRCKDGEKHTPREIER